MHFWLNYDFVLLQQTAEQWTPERHHGHSSETIEVGHLNETFERAFHRRLAQLELYHFAFRQMGDLKNHKPTQFIFIAFRNFKA